MKDTANTPEAVSTAHAAHTARADESKDCDRVVDGHLIRRYRVSGTCTVVYEAWEPVEGSQLADGHSMLTTHSGRWWGQIGTGPLPADSDALPAWSAARSRAFQSWLQGEHARAYALILQTFPEARRGRRWEGEITLVIAAATPPAATPPAATPPAGAPGGAAVRKDFPS